MTDDHTDTHQPTRRTGRAIPESSLSAWQVLSLLRPYLLSLALLSLAAVGLSFLSGITQIALTPLLEIVLGGTGEAVAVSEATSFTFNLANLGTSLLNFVSRATGLTDRWHLLLVISGVYLALALVGQAASFGARYWGLRVRHNIMRDLRHRLFGHILRLPLSFLDRYQAGWLLSRMVNDIRYAMRLVNELIIDGLSNILLSLFYVFLLVRTDARLTIVAAVAGTIQVILSRLLSNVAKERTRSERAIDADLQGVAQERLAAVREIKALAAEECEQTNIGRWLTSQMWIGIRHHVFKQVEGPIRLSINQVVLVGVMLFGMWELFNGHLTTTSFLLFMFFTQSLIGPLAKLAGILLQSNMISASLEGVAYLLAQQPETGGDEPLPDGGFQRALTLEGVNFAYEDMPVLRDINLTIKRGKMVALVGRSGAGKTTLVDLILRFYQPSGGDIRLDGVPVEHFDLAAYRRLFGVVSQESVLFDDTVLNNIAYAHPELARQDVEQAARIANAEEFIDDLPEGYDTVLGERGVRLSGGQRQRIAIARAAAHKPAILVLDEATSSLDSESEQQVQEAIARVIKNSTAIVIAHRLSTIRKADKIVVLKDGHIVEIGTHDELLALDGEYRYLHDLQFQVGETDHHPDQPELKPDTVPRRVSDSDSSTGEGCSGGPG